MFGNGKQRDLHARELAEISSLSERDLEDLGLNQDELRELVLAPEEVRTRQMAMAARFGLTDQDFSDNRHDLVAAIQRCKKCRNGARCERALSVPGLKPDDIDFCPNAEIYHSLAAGI